MMNVVEEGYNAIASQYHESRKNGPTGWFEELIPYFNGNRILDAGCGAGVPTAKFFADKGFTVTGIDISDAMLDIARREVTNATFIHGNLVKLPFEDRSFDIVLCMFAIIHVERDLHKTVLAEFHRVLAKGGTLVVSMGVIDNPSELRENWKGAPMYWSHFDSTENLALIESAGFEILRQEVSTTKSGEQHQFVIARKL